MIAFTYVAYHYFVIQRIVFLVNSAKILEAVSEQLQHLPPMVTTVGFDINLKLTSFFGQNEILLH